MKSGLHIKAINLSDKWFVYPVSFDCIATFEIAARQLKLRESIQFAVGVFKEKVKRSILEKLLNNDKDYKVITGKLIFKSEIKMATIIPFQLKM